MRITVGADSPVATLRGISGTLEPMPPGNLQLFDAILNRKCYQRMFCDRLP
jgi:hypothetical protein